MPPGPAGTPGSGAAGGSSWPATKASTASSVSRSCSPRSSWLATAANSRSRSPYQCPAVRGPRAMPKKASWLASFQPSVPGSGAGTSAGAAG